ncbi:MAG: filamentous hemagglutinin N-terminal domain-containing protein, partial [Zoogloeaceae bacterium]|nr:filamentous hemagglutinin N-terminal domain-containing protein [Zoogloeaceae bacterium]
MRAHPTLTNRLILRLILALAAGSVPAYAQIVADPGAPGNQRPTVLTAPNGVPLVNIQTPSAAGVSRNTYRQFDVNQQGAILNNARTNAQTQLGGWVTANPNLAAGAARVILNEVNSSNPSLLNGFVEIAGSKAQLVIANPAGISCDGCGFINASRATLTTGMPILDNGNLTGYQVNGGLINVFGNGLDAASGYADLIARAVEINAGLWASQINVVTGTNRIGIDNSGQTTAITPIAADSPAPAFGIDVAALGGMYAGKITLVGTEAGVGVRNAGTIGATAGDVSITADGQLVNGGAIAANGNLTLALQGDLTNSGDILANGNLTAATNADLANSGKLQAGQSLTLAARNIDNAAAAEISGLHARIDAAQSLTNRGLIDSEGDTFVSAQTLANTGAGRLYGNHVALIADSIANTAETVAGVTAAGTIAARQRLDLAADQLQNRDGALIFSGGDMAIGGTLDADHRATGQAGDLLNRSAAIEALGNLDIVARSLINERSAFSMERVLSTDLPEGIDLLAYNPALQFFWPYRESSTGTWLNVMRERLLNSVNDLLGGTLDPAYRAELAAAVNAMPIGAPVPSWDDTTTFRYSRNIWATLIDKINADHPEYIDAMAATLASQLSFPLTIYSQMCTGAECSYVYYDTTQRTDYKDIITSDAPSATVLAGGNAKLAIDDLTNRYSTIEAGGDLELTGNTLTNEGAELFLITETNRVRLESHWAGGLRRPDYSSATSSTLIGSAPAIIGAGGTLTGSYTDRIDNISIRENTAPLAEGGGASPAAPGLDPLRNSSLYHPALDPTSRYLIETDPRFANYRAWLS